MQKTHVCNKKELIGTIPEWGAIRVKRSK